MSQQLLVSHRMKNVAYLKPIDRIVLYPHQYLYIPTSITMGITTSNPHQYNIISPPVYNYIPPPVSTPVVLRQTTPHKNAYIFVQKLNRT